MSTPEEKLREELLEFIREEEFSDAPLKTFRVDSYIDSETAINLTITAKTQLGAIIALADWCDENDGKMCISWEYFLGVVEGDDNFVDVIAREEDVAEEAEDSSIKHHADELIKLMFQGGDDNHIAEVTNPVTLTPFTDTFRKSSGKA